MEGLEHQANLPIIKKKQHLSENEVEYLARLIEKHGNDTNVSEILFNLYYIIFVWFGFVLFGLVWFLFFLF